MTQDNGGMGTVHEPSALKGLSADMKHLWANKEGADVVITCNVESFEAHSWVLKLRSPRFKALLDAHTLPPPAVLEINDYEICVMKIVVQYCYGLDDYVEERRSGHWDYGGFGAAYIDVRVYAAACELEVPGLAEIAAQAFQEQVETSDVWQYDLHQDPEITMNDQRFKKIVHYLYYSPHESASHMKTVVVNYISEHWEYFKEETEMLAIFKDCPQFAVDIVTRRE